MKTHYELLEVLPTAAADEVKRAFRAMIARYHPDKVQHLGPEFQEIAATRASELTEAYRVLSHEGRRAEYDAQLKAAPAEAPGPAAEPAAEGAARPKGAQFAQERASRDTFVRKAILERFRQALLHVASGYDEAPARGFDISCTPKAKMFTRGRGPRLLGRLVPRVDRPSVADAWARAGKLNVTAGEDICVILMGTEVAPPRELADAIAEQRRRPWRGGKVTLIPVNASVWDAHMPTDAPDVAKSLLTRLRTGA